MKRAQWVETECSWPSVARQYAEFLASRGQVSGLPITPATKKIEPAAKPVRVEPEYILSWSPDRGRQRLRGHASDAPGENARHHPSGWSG